MPEPVTTTPDTELRNVVERALSTAYELETEIGRGGMGIVYRARDRRLKRRVAVKILPPELAFRSEIRTRFLREAETAAQLSHPNIVPIYAVDEAEGLVFFVMAYVDGDNLGKRLHDVGPLPIPEVRRILAEVADALAYAHTRGVVHRDIKPDNILLCCDDDDRAMVTDFGIARAVIEGSDARLTATGMAIGTPAYMSPEQSAGDREIDGRSDVYALGVVAYQMLAGELPFQATSTPAMLVKHLSERPTPVQQRRPDCPPDLAAIVMRCLEKEPSARFASAQEMEEALRRAPVAPGQFATTQSPALPPMPLAGLPPAAQRAPTSRAPLPPRPAGAAERAGAYGAADGAGAHGMRVDVAWNRPGDLAARSGGAMVTTGSDYAFTPQELLRWEAPVVKAFRRKLGWYVIINTVFLLMWLFGDSGLIGVTGLWTVYLAYKYAQLWSEGFDWRDVLRQPKDRLLQDVMAEGADNVAAVFDPMKRERLRERARRRRELFSEATALSTQGLGSGEPARGALGAGAYAASDYPAGRADEFGELGDVVRQANADRDEIVRLLAAMPRGERERVADVAPSARALADKVGALARMVADLDRNLTPGAVEVLEGEISRLEGEANPLDRAGSEERVKRLAYLKRQRRAMADMGRRREQAAGKLESCRLALQNMRLDLVRLRTGSGGSPLQVTTVAERALALAHEVDGLVGSADEVRGASGRGGAGGSGGGSPNGAVGGSNGLGPSRA